MQAENRLRVPRKVLISRGAVGWVHKIDDQIVLKTPRKHDDAKFAHEIKIYDILESYHSRCPDICRSFLRVANANFLAYCSGGSLEQRLQRYQIRTDEPHGGRLIRITQKEPLHITERWVMELSSAAAWLESLGYVHTDIRPPNILLDGQDHLKLVDFDCVEEIGSRAAGSAPPWARLRGSEGGDESGSFGYNGARTEQFTLGSVFYLMTRGHEPYDDGVFGPDDGPKIVELLRSMEFPVLGNGKLDQIIDRCWKGRYVRLKDLESEVNCLEEIAGLPRATALQDQDYRKIQEKCSLLIASGLLEG